MTHKINNRLPVKMNITIASANEAIEYWLTHAVLKSHVKVEKVTFTEADHFTIELDREIKIDE
jgi:hypothetical protein